MPSLQLGLGNNDAQYYCQSQQTTSLTKGETVRGYTQLTVPLSSFNCDLTRQVLSTYGVRSSLYQVFLLRTQQSKTGIFMWLHLASCRVTDIGFQNTGGSSVQFCLDNVELTGTGNAAQAGRRLLQAA